MQHESKVQDAALLVVRVIVAAVFMYAGVAKWMFWSAPPEGMGMSGTMIALMKFLSIVEPLAAVALIGGILTRVAASGLAIVMIGAIVITRMNYGTHLFTNQEGTGLDYNFLLLAGCLVLAAFGAGQWSADAVFRSVERD